ncbi:Pea2 protein [Saccharomycopsis crataegensis]|uniref:Pea2 protein n=1 Tax=Saccharomycopsis crataegensis TaxID=43959 RepID=A0AAV5QUP3_9ASCO|nr:Pea2 protein [Saccharomycopsis crataegensis]
MSSSSASNNQVLLTGLSLIHDSPFKSSRSPNPNSHNPVFGSSPLLNQYDDKSFANLYNFLKTDYRDRVQNNGVIGNPNQVDQTSSENDLNYLNDSYKFYLSELSNTLINNDVNKKGADDQSQPNNNNNTSNNDPKPGFPNLKDIKLSDDIKTLFNATKNSNTNDLILKILIENALYNLNLYLESTDELEFLRSSLKKNRSTNTDRINNSTILSLDEIKKLKRKILALVEERKALQTSVNDSIGALKDILEKYQAQDVDPTGIANADYKPSSRQSRLEFESINTLNSKLERQLIGSSLSKYLLDCDKLKIVNDKIESHQKRLFSHFFTCLVIGYINNISINLKLQKNITTNSLSPVSTPRSPTFSEYLFKSPMLNSPMLGKKNASSMQMIENKTAIFNKSIDEIVSFVASVAVQKDIQLPDPVDKRTSMMISDYNYNNNDEILSKTSWVKGCINRILNYDQENLLQESTFRENVHLRNTKKDDSLEGDISPNSSETSVTSVDFSPSYHLPMMKSPMINRAESPFGSRSSSVTNNNNSKEVNDLRTKIKDLKFANDYLTKQFKTERESFNKILAEQNLMKLNLEKKLTNAIQNLEQTNLLLMQTEASNGELERKANDSFNTINQLNKQVTQLRIENLGTASPQKSLAEAPMTHKGLSSISVERLDDDTSLTMPGAPGNMAPVASPSAGIMRTEFKKIIDDINNKHFVELTNEITERKRLENLVKMYKEKLDGVVGKNDGLFN